MDLRNLWNYLNGYKGTICKLNNNHKLLNILVLELEYTKINYSNKGKTYKFLKSRNVRIISKELSFCHNLKFSNFYISATSGHKPLIFQT